MTEYSAGNKIIRITTSDELEIENDQTVPASAMMLTSSGSITRNQPYILTFRTGVDAKLFLDNVLHDSNSKTAATPWAGAYLGMTSNPANLYITELLVWNTELTDEELATAYQYLVDKYGL